MHLHLFNEFGTVGPEQTGKRMVVRFIEELNTTSLSQLSKGFNKMGIPTLTLFDEDTCYAVGYLEPFGIVLEAVYLFQNDAVGGKVTLSGGTFKDLSV
jgi:hypothetical protein